MEAEGLTTVEPIIGYRKVARLASCSCLFVGMAAAILAGCRTAKIESPPTAAGAAWFEDVTERVGVHFTHDAGPIPTDRYFLPQIIGSGVALLDYDGDGRLDLYFIQNGGPESKSPNRLFHQDSNGNFRDVSAGSGLDVTGYGMGVAVGDVNNDGRTDVVLTEFGRLRLFVNQNTGSFSEISESAGLKDPMWGTAASFLDYDRDGWLDLVVVHYVQFDGARICSGPARDPDFCHPSSFPGTVTRLYRNCSNKTAQAPSTSGTIRFEEVTVSAGLSQTPGPGLGVLCSDFNGDHWPDIFVANDARPNRLWVNQQNGTFKEEAIVRGLAYSGLGQAQGNMGVAYADVDANGLPDLFVTHLSDELHTLWLQEARGRFQDRTAFAGLARRAGTGFGTVLADFDRDGSCDLAIVNGRVSRKNNAARVNPADIWSGYTETNQLFRNDGGGRFIDVSAANADLCGRPNIGRALAVGDLDGDGALDLVTTGVGEPARIFRNVAPSPGHWLMVRALDSAHGQRDAYGTKVAIQCAERRWERYLNPAHSYLCSNDPRLHFGLGAAVRVDRLVVTWPDGTEESFPGTEVDRLLVLKKGEGTRRP